MVIPGQRLDQTKAVSLSLSSSTNVDISIVAAMPSHTVAEYTHPLLFLCRGSIPPSDFLSAQGKAIRLEQCIDRASADALTSFLWFLVVYRSLTMAGLASLLHSWGERVGRKQAIYLSKSSLNTVLDELHFDTVSPKVRQKQPA
jgi:hypothetical protein